MRSPSPALATLLLSAILAGCSGATSDDAPSGSATRSSSPAPTTGPTNGPTAPDCVLDSVKTFADVPEPGYPYGLGVHDGTVFVSTSAGYPGHPPNNDGERVFTFNATGALTATLTIPTGSQSTMGLADFAFDNASGGGRVYIVDMNARVLRTRIGATLAAPTTYAAFPAPHNTHWSESMPIGMAFASDGAAYLADDAGRIWKVPPGGAASVWLEDPVLRGSLGSGLGPYAARIGPDGQLYVGIADTAQSDRYGDGLVYRIELKATPQASDLHLFYRSVSASHDSHPELSAMAFGASGKLYVALSATNEIAVVGTDGVELRRIHDDAFRHPLSVAFHNETLLVANSDLDSSAPTPANWKVFGVCVREKGLPIVAPAAIP